ncbi:MAG TPA: hypothetical protein VFO83_01570 [Aggregicoccus sp.]|nr:hypothetical protein [Aggregicoccus sp.]
MKRQLMKRPLVVAVLLGTLALAGLSTQVAAQAREGEAQEARVEAALDARQRQVLGGLLRAQRAGALARR